jgi:glycosyltransferase involved in cell wall biosynthesis
LRTPTLSLVIPLYCEGGHLRESVSEIHRNMESCGKSYEVVLVDDGSHDSTWDTITSLAGEYSSIRAFRFSRNFGKEAAMSAGIELARGRAVIVMDGDLQHPPELIPEMVRLWEEEGYHVVDTVKASRGSEALWYRLSARLFGACMSRMSGFDLSGASDFKLLDRRVVDAWLQMRETLTFYRGMTEWLGFRHARLPMHVAARRQGASSWSVLRLMRLAVAALTSFSSVLLQGVTALGLLFIVFAGIFGVYTVGRYMKGSSLEGFATVILLQLIIGGTIMLSLGIIGQYLANIYWETKKRPRYVLMDRIDAGSGDAPGEAPNHGGVGH